MLANDSIQVIVGNEDVSSYVENLSWSAVDPGGFEAASMDFQRNIRVPRGTPVRVFFGQSVAWEGRVNEVNRQLSAQPMTQIGCQGFGARFKENGQAMIFVDRDFSKWSGPSTARRISLQGAGWSPQGPTLTPDVLGNPCLITEVSDTWTITSKPINEAHYDIGPACTIGSLYYAWTKGTNINAADTNWTWNTILSPRDDLLAGPNDDGAEQRATGPGTGTLVASKADKRYATARVLYALEGSAGTAGVKYTIFWTVLAVYGNHHIAKRGTNSATDAQGFYPSDIVRYVQQTSYPTAQINVGVIEDATSFIIPHLVYYTPVTWEQMIDDMSKMAACHYGTWEGPGLDLAPQLDFRSYPGTPTCWTSASDVDDLQINDSLDGLYNVANVTYRDTSGSIGVKNCTRIISALDEFNIIRTLYLDMGLATSVSAQAFGNLVLAISERNAATTGSFSTRLPVIRTGGDTPAFMLRPGIDRLKITDLTADGDGQTEMIVKHITATPDESGITTQVELGRGADLIETIQARLTAGLTAAGLG